MRKSALAVTLGALLLVAAAPSAAQGGFWTSCRPVSVVNPDTSMLTHRVSCPRARRVINRVFVKAQNPDWDHMARGFKCRLRPNAARAIRCHRGSRLIRSPIAG